MTVRLDTPLLPPSLTVGLTVTYMVFLYALPKYVNIFGRRPPYVIRAQRALGKTRLKAADFFVIQKKYI